MYRISYVLVCILFIVMISSCSLNNVIADAFSGSDGAGTVFMSDPDMELVGDALPFAIKMYETILARAPKHQGMQIMTGSLFVMYANAFVQWPALQLNYQHLAEKRSMNERAKALYIRGYDILVNGFNWKFKGFKDAFASQDKAQLQAILQKMTSKKDAQQLYWIASSIMGAMTIDVLDSNISPFISGAVASLKRAYAINPDDIGIMELFILYYGSPLELDLEKARVFFETVVEKTGGLKVSPYVGYATVLNSNQKFYEDGSMPEVDQAKELLHKALAIDINAEDALQYRMLNVYAQKQARKLLSDIEELYSDNFDYGDE